MNFDEDREPLIMSSFEADPFYSVRDNVNAQVEKLKAKYEKFQLLLKNPNSSMTEFKELRKNLVKDAKAADKDLKGLKGAVEMVEKNRAKFSLINDRELDSRRAFVNEAQESINVVKTGVDSPLVRRRIEEDEKSTASLESSSNPMAKDNARFVANQQQQTARLIEQQDGALDALGGAVDRLGNIAKDISGEVKEQNVLLDSLGNEVDDAHNKMDVVTASLSKLLQTKDGCQIWTIVILTFILILLIALVIWS